MTSSPAHRPVYGFAHRGGRGHGPDNSIGTFREALTRGATALETDAWVTADGVVVLDHDGVHRPVHRRRTPIAALRRGDLDRRVASLEDLYAECGSDFDLAVDVREPQVAVAVVHVARCAGATSRLWLVAPTWQPLPAWRGLDPDVRLVHTPALHARTVANARAARAAGADALNLPAPWWTSSAVRRAHALGLLAFAYGANTSMMLSRALRRGCDGVFSDHVARMTEAIAAAALG